MFTYERNFRLLKAFLLARRKAAENMLLAQNCFYWQKKQCLIESFKINVLALLAKSCFFGCSVTRAQSTWHIGTYYVGSLPCQ